MKLSEHSEYTRRSSTCTGAISGWRVFAQPVDSGYRAGGDEWGARRSDGPRRTFPGNFNGDAQQVDFLPMGILCVVLKTDNISHTSDIFTRKYRLARLRSFWLKKRLFLKVQVQFWGTFTLLEYFNFTPLHCISEGSFVLFTPLHLSDSWSYFTDLRFYKQNMRLIHKIWYCAIY